MFTIVSPLAFVALVLPKTEKWFDRWKDTFVAMLIMFPLFSLVFGGAVLAGGAIIASANNNIFLILLGKGNAAYAASYHAAHCQIQYRCTGYHCQLYQQ